MQMDIIDSSAIEKSDIEQTICTGALSGRNARSIGVSFYLAFIYS